MYMVLKDLVRRRAQRHPVIFTAEEEAALIARGMGALRVRRP